MTRHGRVGIWLRVLWVIIWPADAVVFKLRFRGKDNVPKHGGVIIAANHVSHADPLTFARFVWDAGRVPRFLIKAEVFTKPVLKQFMYGSGQIPVHRGTSDAQQSLQHALTALDKGEAVCIYPEGTVTKDPDWWPMASRTGVARLALATGAPVVPVGQWGAQHAVDLYRKKFRLIPRKKVWCVAGPVIDLSAYRDRPQTTEVLREVTDLIMRQVRDLVAEIRDEKAPDVFWKPPRKTPKPEAAEAAEAAEPGAAP